MTDRRQFLHLLGGTLLLAAALPRAATAAAPLALPRDRLAELERASGGRLGVAVLDTATGRSLGWRDEERFAMCSTFKFLLAAAVLQRVDRGELTLDRRLPIRKDDLIHHSPVTERHVGSHGLAVADLCEATMTLSDNAAANLLLPLVGGPAGLTATLRAWGDATTRLDRPEPHLNDVPPGDPRDTTTPREMAAHVQRLVLGDLLQPASRERLTGWLAGNRTGDHRLRAGLPKGWRVGDKTGSGPGTTNDVAIVWPEGRAPFALACYLTGSSLKDDGRNAILASVAREVAGLYAAA
ncbi:class A beta-lactamase [Dokdonella koreensis]|uniref:Beta-lactamase n=1 Tax=Dokdonella koreensis DS-123 TaxID=1300342 RepID=A0A161HIN5_9GAMM|nr:class A beta-lactamase [Dokdonella koreensis]ANB16270.1 Beta-lactamase [Dokdonella koreensis DS-123]